MNTLIICAASIISLQPEFETVYWDTVTKDGRFDGGRLLMEMSETTNFVEQGIAGVTTIIDNGPTDNRIDIVFVGDGYTVSDLDDYEDHVQNALDGFFGIEPLESYLPLFNVHRVDVLSNESGVDNDPQGTYRDTAMDMTFWCNNIERLLCVNVSSAWSYTNNAPDVDSILAVANSSKYGGAGYSSSEIGTFSGDNANSVDVAIHEFGHSMGNLADEYFYTNDTYTGSEPGPLNVSIYDYDEMLASGTKWANWLGENDSAWDGLCSTYEGAMYHEFGIYRPSNNSMMRALARPFNQISAESFIIEFYKIVEPLDAHASLGPKYIGDDIYITPIEMTHAYDIEWTVNGKQVNLSNSFTVASLGLPVGTHTVAVTVVDPTPWVRNETARNTYMTQSVSWPVVIDEPFCPEDINGDGTVNVTDLLSVIGAWGSCSGCSEDLNSDGSVNVTDLLQVIENWGSCSL